MYVEKILLKRNLIPESQVLEHRKASRVVISMYYLLDKNTN